LTDDATKIFELITLAGVLKRVPRYGWIISNVPICDVESVADHSFRVALISMLIAEYSKKNGYDVDVKKTIELALIHDIAESKLQDLNYTAIRYIGKDHKIKTEQKIVSEIFSKFPIEDLDSLWNELIEEKSIESKIVRYSDILDMLFQALTYERSGIRKENLDEFWEDLNELKNAEMPIVRELAKLLENERNKLRG